MKHESLNLLYFDPAVRFEVDADFISLHPKHGYRDGYNIERSRLQTPEKILGWAEHLSHKGWMDAESLSTFVCEAFELIGIEPDHNL